MVFIVSNVPGLTDAGGAEGRVAAAPDAAPDAAPLPTLLLPPPPRRMLSSSSSVRALLRRILKKRASRLHTTATLILGALHPCEGWQQGVNSAGCTAEDLISMVRGNLPPQREADECNPEIALGAPLLAHAASLNEGAICLRANMETPVFCKLLSCLQGSCKHKIPMNVPWTAVDVVTLVLHRILTLLTQESHPSDNEHKMEQA